LYKTDSDNPIELSLNRQGNYWGRSEYPYFCEYGNQNASCLNSTYDSNRPDVIDSCPYNQSYPPGQWPESPVCPQFCYVEGRTCVDNSGRHDPYCVGRAVHSYMCLNNRCILNDAIPMCPYDQKCVNGTCVNLTQCESQGGICAETCPAGYYQADFSCTAPAEAPAATAAGEIQKATPKTGFFDWLFKILGFFFTIIPTPADSVQPLPPAPEAITPNETNETNTSSIQTGGTMPNIEPTPPEIQPDQQNTQVVTQPAETPQTSPTTPVVTRPTAQSAGTVTEPAKTVVPTTQTQTKTPTTTKTVCCMKI
jgi:hypothetical protein